MIHNKTVTMSAEQTKAMKILAKSVYRNLQAGGYGKCEVLHFATEVLGLLTSAGRDAEGEEDVTR